MKFAKIRLYLKGLALAIAGKGNKHDLTQLSEAVIIQLRERGFEVRKIQQPLVDLTTEEILALPCYEASPDIGIPGAISFLNIFRGVWNDGTFGNDPVVDNIRQTNAATTLLTALKNAGYERVKYSPPPKC